MDKLKSEYNKAISDISKIFYSDKSLSSIFYDIDKFLINNTNQEEQQMKNLSELTKEELEQRRVDMDLFALLFPIFDRMSRIGKVTTIDTLIMYLDLEKEE